jgi:hypothetical protein
MQPTDITHADDNLALRREDLALLTAGYVRESQSWRQWGFVAAGFAGLTISVILIQLAENLGWPVRLEPVFLGCGWASMIGCGVLLWRRERRLRVQYRFDCPSCGGKLLNGIRGGFDQTRVELVIATGTCPICGTAILAP